MSISFYRASAAALCLSLVLVAAPAMAVTQIPQPLTLGEALAWARKYNPTVRAAQIRIERLTGRAIHADVAVPSNPRVELEAGQRSNRREDTTDIGVRLSQELWIAGQSGLREAAAQGELGAARADYLFLQASTQARVRAAFLSVLVAERAVDTARQVVDANQKLAAYANKRLNAGAGTQLEANAARIGQSRAQALLAGARNRARQAGLALNDLLAIDPRRRLAVDGQLTFAPLDLPRESQLLSRAVARRTDLEAAGQRVLASRKRLSLANRQIIPNLTVFGFYRQEADGRSGGGDDIVGGGVGFDLPVLHRYAGERKSANAELNQALLDQDNLQRDVRLQVISGIAGYESASQQVAALNDVVLNAAQQTLELTRRSFAAGQVAVSAITTAQNNLIAVRQDYLDALRSLISAGTDLERATGGLVVMQAANTATESN